MEWRHTLEILTKDIQDIEKLVGNLQNSASGPSIDLDLALSKLRNVYEVLNMIKEDQMEEKRAMHAATKPSPPKAEAPEEPVGQPKAEAPEEPVDQPKAEAPKEPADPPDAEASLTKEEEPQKIVPEDPGHATGTTTNSAGKGILAEKFSAASSINDNLAGKRPAGKESKLAAKPIDNIHRNIGINDRFLIIRELFKGDADSFRDLITELDEAGTLQNATTLLHRRFPENTEHEGLDILEGLIKRRFTEV